MTSADPSAPSSSPSAPRRSTRALSGIQPTGRFHWGNYFGAIRQYIELQPDAAGSAAGDEAYYFIADLHALTTVREPDRLRRLVHDAAIDLVALGLDPERAVLFVQSDVPEVTELTWLLMSVTPMGLLERCHAYKDKKTRGLPADAGLFTYPVLMAADILAYDATVVPVGEDQVQHIEVCRDLAGTFNHLYGEVFTLPKPRLVEGGAKVPGTDGQKMSKSYSNTIDVFEEPAAGKKKIMRITTDSRPMEESKDPDTDHLFVLYALMATAEERQAMADLYRRGGFGYGEVKKALVEVSARYFAEARARRAALEADPTRIEAILEAGAAKARAKARAVLERARAACGLGRAPGGLGRAPGGLGRAAGGKGAGGRA
jgi:tryptophanyl-tRNA synthetase